MNRRGVEFTVVETSEPNVWRWEFRIADTVTTGGTETALFGMAARRAQLRIDEALQRLKGEFDIASRQS
jgi:hypothetical protein